ncbi:amidohydrolase family protein [Silvibacterium acidisoli]|uniref:amidohydrolase family protein n=1 Tax=Acidobacteriaceae bacterium ZG23-2 TaxID=2883246 RepID=UPI00406C73BE
MRVITLEEHMTIPEIVKATSHIGAGSSDYMRAIQEKLIDVDQARIADMDANGIDLQVLSQVSTGLDLIDPAEATALARATNDRMAQAIADRPTRFAGFAALNTTEPEKAARELERAMAIKGFVGTMLHGTSNGLFLDDPRFSPIFEAAQALDAPIYLHPAPPPETVQKAYYSGLGDPTDYMLATAGWGWHVETGMHALRLIVSGLFDRFPRLKIIIGHMGENLPFSIVRASTVLSRGAKNLKRPVKEYFDEHFWITTSGYFSNPPLKCALEVCGAERILFSVDYPFGSNRAGREFLDSMPVSDTDRAKIAGLNAAKLLKL